VVDEKGCPKDSDGDGVPDGIDACPDTEKGWPVDEKGCPKDSDGDGVPDGRDKCPNTPKGAMVDADGCPKDSDGDGVPDGVDKCANTPRGTKVDATGCPTDSDGDGVDDGRDKCPNTPRGTKVDANGCPADSDGDGVPDGTDKCPDTTRGTKVDANGCPELFVEGQRTVVLEGVTFEHNSATLTAASKTTLDRVAASLAASPSVKVEVAGHTDASGSDAYNRKLSQTRAEAVRDYLMSKGVQASQLTATGYGESKPVADNNTDAGRANNRRVELNRQD
jgi:outer membrane protein OmpA-like peptidoglycan-associated protein